MLAVELVNALIDKKIKIATAESCTGGLISQLITSVPGASGVFDCGIVSYSNKIKNSILGVSNKTLEIYGAVSEQTAIEMARGVLKLANADVAVSVTGIAGPGGGTAKKPIGTVYVCVCTSDTCKVLRFLFEGNRESVRKQTAEKAIKFVLEQLYKIHD